MTQFTLLAALALGGSATTNELSRTLVVDRTTLTRNLRLLRKAGWIATQAGGSGRERRFVLTPDGTAALSRAFPLWLAAQTSVVEAFDPARWPALVADLGRVVEGVTGEQVGPSLAYTRATDVPVSTNGASASDEAAAF
jgi:DNA-binding MarR family transcriptional regulator